MEKNEWRIRVLLRQIKSFESKVLKQKSIRDRADILTRLIGEKIDELWDEVMGLRNNKEKGK